VEIRTDDRPGAVLELLLVLVEPDQPGHIRGQQIQRELDAPESAAQRDRQGACQGSLADAGHILQQHIPFAQHRHRRQVDGFIFSDNHFLYVFPQLPGSFSNLGHLSENDG